MATREANPRRRRRYRRRRNPSAPIGALAVVASSFAGMWLGYLFGGMSVADETPPAERLVRTQPYATAGGLLGAAAGYALVR